MVHGSTPTRVALLPHVFLFSSNAVGGVRPREWIGSISLFQYRDSTGLALAAVEFTILAVIVVQGVLVRFLSRFQKLSSFAAQILIPHQLFSLEALLFDPRPQR